MKFLALCFLAFILIFLLHRWNRIVITDYTKEHTSKLYKRVAGLMIITVSLIIYTAISITF
jgi:hypothetical protein